MSDDWAQNLAEELHKPVRRKFPKRKVFVKGIDDTWAADLVEMGSFKEWNEGVRYLLMVIDVFSKYGWIRTLKNKRGDTVAEAFKSIFEEGRKPKKLWVDKGKEFWNKDVKAVMDEEGVERYSTENEEKSAVVERWNRTIKERMWKMFSAKNDTTYVDKLGDILVSYNRTKHSSIGMTPAQASRKNNERKVYAKLYEKELWKKRKGPKFKVGDKVRITVKKKSFEKGFTPKWTEEVFVVDKVIFTKPVTYKLKDLMEEEVDGSFYEQELQKTEQENFRIEDVIDRNEKTGEVLVKWSGYPEKFNEWIPEEDTLMIEKNNKKK